MKKKGGIDMMLNNLIKRNSTKERKFKMVIKLKHMKSLKERLMPATVLVLAVLCLIGFITAESDAVRQQVLAIDYLASSRSHTATMQVNDKAEVVWQSVVALAKKRNPNNLKIKVENKEKLKFEASKITEDDQILWGSVQVRSLSATSCRLIFTATMGGGKPIEKEMKDFVQETLLQFCDEKGLTCKISE
ncbi:MAG: hypothetical protein GQ556_03205 [Desulfobacterales bacterium]|nr:hypothetical protein [Desulfobacterales bacterium]